MAMIFGSIERNRPAQLIVEAPRPGFAGAVLPTDRILVWLSSERISSRVVAIGKGSGAHIMCL